ncbi:hypothetical protein THRCLA_06986 [Thraustotheca clavata]|uniref:START domain-containing protein n=1 Tax=Thraustotheca clavata TaxID=74557 RepID=A0A1V9ZHD6_9STRA|nr:hypothetical protein THRCLA_06986 [Thraustotheca clavata]
MSTYSEDDAILNSAFVGDYLDGLLLGDLEPLDNHQHVRKRQKDELVYLRQQVAQLTTELAALTEFNDLQVLTSENYWERVARNQKKSLQQASAENNRLKRALNDQLQLATSLNRLLVKRPRLAIPPSMDIADWKLRRLPMEPTQRAAAYHSLMDDAYHNLATLFIQSKILEAPVGHRMLNVSEQNESIIISFQSVANLHEDFASSSQRLWDIWKEKNGLVIPSANFAFLQDFGPDGVYFRVVANMNKTLPCIYILYAIKRYVEANRVVFVLKTVLEDEMYPAAPNLLVANHTACIIVESTAINQSYRRMVVAGRLPAQIPQESPLLNIQTTVKLARLSEATPTNGYWEQAARNQKKAWHRATLENARLKRVLEDQIRLVGALEKVLIKRPRLAMLPGIDITDCKLRRLPQEPTQREEAFNAILDHAYYDLEAFLLRTKICEKPAGYHKLDIKEEDNSILVSIQSIAHVNKDYLECSHRVWNTWHGNYLSKVPHMRSEVLGNFGPHGLYIRLMSTMDSQPCVCILYAIKRFVLENRVIFVLKSILEDECNPFEPNCLVGNQIATGTSHPPNSVIVESTGPNQSCRRLCVEAKLPSEVPQSNPIHRLNLRVTDAILNIARPAFDEIENFWGILESTDAHPHYQKKQRMELDYLRQQVIELSTELENLSELKPSSGYWEQAARNQKQASNRATLENVRLKRMLEDQLHLANALEKVLVKRPRLAMLPGIDITDWKLRRLPQDPIQREHAFHAILDNTYKDLETFLVRSKILEKQAGYRTLDVHESGNSILVSVQSVVNLNKDYLDCSHHIWNSWHGNYMSRIPHIRSEVLGNFGPHSIYVRLISSFESQPCMCILYAIKRYILEDRVIFLLRSILEDESNPSQPEWLIGNHTAGIIVECTGSNQTCRRLCVEGKLPSEIPQNNPIQHSNVHVTDAILKMIRPVFDEIEHLLA